MIEEIKVKNKKIKLSQEEKDYLEKIASILNKERKEIQEVFLALVSCVTIDLYSGKDEVIIPYLMKLKVKPNKKIIPKGFSIKPEFQIDSCIGFEEIYEKIQLKETTWIEDFVKNMLFKELSLKIDQG